VDPYSLKANDEDLTRVPLNALYKEEQRQRELLSGLIKETLEILTGFIERACQENGVPSPNVKGLNAPQTAQLAINTFQMLLGVVSDKALITQQKEKPVQNTGLLQQENQRLRAEIEALKTQPCAPEPAALPITQAEVRAPSLEAKEDFYPVGEAENKILELAVTGKVIRLKAFEELCHFQLHLSRVEIDQGIQTLVEQGGIEMVNATRVPPYGVMYPILFRPTEKGLNAVYSATKRSVVSELDRLIKTNDGMWLEEVPLFAYAVEEYLPQYGYHFVGYAPETVMAEDPGLRKFFPHALLNDSDGQAIYVMFEGERYQNGIHLKQYLRDFRRLTNDQMYFICVNGRTARHLNGHIKFLEGNVAAHITNLNDWPTYEQRLRSGAIQPAAQSIWFTALRKDIK
jgi:hypothetical protein